MYKIVFSPEALDDLRQIKSYIRDELLNETAATKTLTQITKGIRELAVFPKLGAPLSSIVGINTVYRFLVCGNYTAFYRFEDSTISIVRVLYGRRDFMRILFGEN